MVTVISIIFYLIAMFSCAVFGAAGEEWQTVPKEDTAKRDKLLSDAKFYLLIIALTTVCAVFLQVYS